MRNFQRFKLDLEKAAETEIKFPTATVCLVKQLSFRKICTSLLTMPNPFLWNTKSVENSLRDRNIVAPDMLPEKLLCRSRSSIYCGNGTMDWFQSGGN